MGLAGHVSSPRRTKLGVRTYERLAMLTSLLQSVYIDDDMVAKEYLRRCKNGAWNKDKTDDALKCWNLERVLEAERFGREVPEDLTMDEVLMTD